MKIGIDLDNTIACLDHIFGKVASELDMGDFENNSKHEVKAELNQRDASESLWKKVQGQAYGAQYHLAIPYTDCVSVISSWISDLDIHVFIISHKTRYGHYDEQKVDLQRTALDWLIEKEICNEKLISKNQIYFEETLDAKVQRISTLNLDVFIDDLPRVLEHPDFPRTTIPILFHPTISSHREQMSITEARSWKEIDHIVKTRI